MLREILHEAILVEKGGGNPSYPYIRDAVGPAMSDREAIGSLADDGRTDKEDMLPPHLREPNEDRADDLGPVPPKEDDAGDPYVISDPYTTDYHVLPTPQGKMRSG